MTDLMENHRACASEWQWEKRKQVEADIYEDGRDAVNEVLAYSGG